MPKIDTQEYWNNKYLTSKIGWDAGAITTPLKEYFDQISNKNLKILIPGAGNAWEAEYLFHNGFKNIYLLDFAEEAMNNFKKRCPEFPPERIIINDFFKHKGTYDLIIEQTFFSSILPVNRKIFVSQISNLLSEEGKYIGILFNHEFNYDGPPFGGTKSEYLKLFSKDFDLLVFDNSYNSIKPRKDREIFFIVKKKQ